MCENTIPYAVGKHGERMVSVKCGNTDPYGHRVICGLCETDPVQLSVHKRTVAIAEADNETLASAGKGEI